jgi:PAS domain-containing protein
LSERHHADMTDVTVLKTRSPIPTVQFELIAESIPHIVWMAGPDGSTEYFNRQGTEYPGLSKEANYGWAWVALVHPEAGVGSRDPHADAVRARLPHQARRRSVPVARLQGVAGTG